MTDVFYGGFAGVADIEREFEEPGCLDGCRVLYAEYTYEDYEGDSVVIFERGGQIYRVEAGHCSCYGLEYQWKPEEVTLEQLRQDANLWFGGNDPMISIIEEGLSKCSASLR